MGFVLGEDEGETTAVFGADEFAKFADGQVEDVAEEEDERVECLVLGGGGDVAFRREVGEEGGDG